MKMLIEKIIQSQLQHLIVYTKPIAELNLYFKNNL